ncbi:putative disease resistance protein RGA1 [Phoenix dactylifera]|uniref:Disease resistance protein RGA1 n=1 Tax=Phoenix dactylifera TaxID=42345 RepID=A0A8B7BLH7_PHODC|nr:putative disease resistance protein RGA1 [Phoenix dactylifera]
MSSMSSLRHLEIRGCWGLSCMPRWLGRLSNLQTMPMFITGEERGRTISELEHLNLIGGGLKITNLVNVRDPLEATKADLASKTNLQSLVLMWNILSYMESAASPVSEVEEVFERLQPHSNLKNLRISGYPGIKIPTWMARMELASSPIRNLVTIWLMGLKRCEYLPALGHLPLLESLYVTRMPAVRRIGVEFCGDGGIFPSLRSLNMSGLRDLEEWSAEATAAGKSVMPFPCLEEFKLTECPKLRVSPRVPPSVVKVTIEGDRLLFAVTTGGLYRLKSLTIRNCEALSSPFRWEWMQDLTALTSLHIRDDKLMCLPEGILQLRMPSLQEFYLVFRNLKSISGEERDKQQQPPTFFMTIQLLELYSTKNLTALPEWLGSLTALQKLWISDCPQLLARRCERERGEDWPKIAHIPWIDISPAKATEEDREENSQRSITSLIRKLRLTSCTGHG